MKNRKQLSLALNCSNEKVLLSILPIDYSKQIYSALSNKEGLIEFLIENLDDIFNENYAICILYGINTLKDEGFYKDVKIGFNLNSTVEEMFNGLDSSILKKIKKHFSKNIETVEVSKSLSYVQGNDKRFYELLDYQMSIKSKILNMFYSSDLKRVLVQMPTGTGKTKTAMHTLVNYYLDSLGKGNSILWIAHTNTLLLQAEETLNEIWKNLGVGPLHIYNSISKYENDASSDVFKKGGFIFMSSSKLIVDYKANSDLFKNIYSKCEIIVFDEAHKCVASETVKALENLICIPKNGTNKRYFLGLTATPGRGLDNDVENKKLVNFFDRNIISIDQKIIEEFSGSKQYNNEQEVEKQLIKYFQDRQILSVLKKETLEYNVGFTKQEVALIMKNSKSKSDDFNSEILNIFARKSERNEVIINKLVELDYNKIPTIFFACSVEHGKLIHLLLKAKNIDSQQVYASTGMEERKKIFADFKAGKFNILINQSVLTTGFDSTNIRCVFITSPTKSIVTYSQMIGRGLRGPKMGGNKECLLIDVDDNLERYTSEMKIYEYFERYW
ncbi:MAG: DEAD/DEAH box helicase family protein [Erysipelotrichaceae bacterium]